MICDTLHTGGVDHCHTIQGLLSIAKKKTSLLPNVQAQALPNATPPIQKNPPIQQNGSNF